ncbi:AAA family ATPase [Paenibacillus silviterrae]|uniref:AAA family ATPase n=1 Tax=Paenibacillus silviterrae TaxID=3242194 RepID=UPI002542A2DE|nr:AAA family ATPase [Paenibacillus chinjuensis]
MISSERFYGREDELEVLKTAFHWASLGSTELVLISGQPGIGKSSLVQEAFKPSVIGKCYFASGKFDQYQAGVPYEPFIKCFQTIIKQLLTEPEPQFQNWTKRVKEAVGPNGALIADVIPEAALLLGESPPSEGLSSKEARQRFERVFHRFVQVFTRVDHPLVLFFDDMQWADDASLSLLHSLMDDPESQHLLVIAAYREPEHGRHPFEHGLPGDSPGYSVRRLELRPLEFEQIRDMLADSLECRQDEVVHAAHTLAVKSAGNPFYVKQLFRTACDERYIALNSSTGRWEWDLKRLNGLPEFDGQIGNLAARINKLPPPSRELSVICACLGSKFTDRLLSAVSGYNEADLVSNLAPAIREGLLLTENTDGAVTHYRFTHDRIQQAAYSMLDDRRLKEIHLTAGRFLLLQEAAAAGREQALFDIVNHFNQALELLSAEDRELAARLNEEAGRKAMQSSAYQAALQYFTTAIGCLPDHDWERDREFMFQLYLKCSECEFLCGHNEAAEARLNEVLRRARDWTERARVYTLKIEQYSNAMKYTQAIALGLTALREVGIRIPERPNKLVILKEILLTKRLLAKRMQELASLPEISDPKAKVMMELLVALVAPTFFSDREVFAVIASKFIRLTYKFGSTSLSPSLYAAFAMLLGTVLGQYQMGYKLGAIAVESANRSGIASVMCKVYVMFYGVISPWVRYDREDEDKLERAVKLGLDAGDYVYASYAVGSLINLAYARCSMDQIHEVNRKHLQVLEHTQEELVFKNALIYMDYAQKMSSPGENVFSITDGRADEAEFLKDMLKDEGKAVTLYQLYTYKAQIHYLFGNYPEAIHFAELANPYEAFSAHAPHLAEHHIYEALSIAAAWEQMTSREKAFRRSRLKRLYRQFQAWDRMAPENFRHKFLLLQAEIARLKGSDQDVIDLYDRAIVFARERKYVQFQAVTCELAAKYHLHRGRLRMARSYLEEAYEAYGAWGAESKRCRLKAEYPEWLQEPETEQPWTDGIDGREDADELHAGKRNPEQRESAFQEIDLAAIVKASLSLSQGMNLDEIRQQLMKIILDAAAAEKAALIVKRNGELWVEAVQLASGEWPGGPKPLVDCEDAPVSFVQYASRLERLTQLSDALQDDLFRSDPYIVRNQCKTVCSIPLFLQEQFSGVLFLEDNGRQRHFTDHCIETVRILASQALFVCKLTGPFEDSSVSAKVPGGKPGEQTVDSLTERELEVLNLMASGMTNKEIAFQLGVTVGTVKVHTHNLFSKLHVNRRTKAIAEAKKKKILE